MVQLSTSLIVVSFIAFPSLAKPFPRARLDQRDFFDLEVREPGRFGSFGSMRNSFGSMRSSFGSMRHSAGGSGSGGGWSRIAKLLRGRRDGAHHHGHHTDALEQPSNSQPMDPNSQLGPSDSNSYRRRSLAEEDLLGRDFEDEEILERDDDELLVERDYDDLD